MHDCLLEGVVPKPQVWHEQLPPGQGPGPCWAGWRVAWPQSHRSWPELAQLSLPAPKRLFFLTESWVKSQWSWPGCTPQAPPGVSTQAGPAPAEGPGVEAPCFSECPALPPIRRVRACPKPCPRFHCGPRLGVTARGSGGSLPPERPSSAGVLAAAGLHPAPLTGGPKAVPSGHPGT